MMRPRIVLALLLVSHVLACAGTREPPRVAVLVRHAEKASDGTADPSLSPAGVERARELASLLGAERVTHLFATHYRRTQETLAPLAERTGVNVEVFGADEDEKLLAAIRALPPGATAVIAGHSNTVPGLVRSLEAHREELVSTEALADHEYDRLFVVVLDACSSASRTIELRFGSPSAPAVAP